MNRLGELEKLFQLEQELDIPMKDRFHKTLSDDEIKKLNSFKEFINNHHNVNSDLNDNDDDKNYSA